MQNRIAEIMNETGGNHMNSRSDVVVVAVAENEKCSNVIKFPQNKEKQHFIIR